MKEPEKYSGVGTLTERYGPKRAREILEKYRDTQRILYLQSLQLWGMLDRREIRFTSNSREWIALVEEEDSNVQP